jgi:hypothetical protein
VQRRDLGRDLWLVASVAEGGQSVQATTPALTPRATSALSCATARPAVKAGTSIGLRGRLRSAALPARHRITIELWQRVGSRWVLRRVTKVQTTTAGVFTLSYRPAMRGHWRAGASFTGAAGLRPAASGFATFTVR